MTLAARTLAAYRETGNVIEAARRCGCHRRYVYTALKRAGVPVRAYRRRAPLRLVTAANALAEWQAARKRAIDDELRVLRARWRRELNRAAKGVTA